MNEPTRRAGAEERACAPTADDVSRERALEQEAADLAERLRVAAEAATRERLERERLQFLASLTDTALRSTDHLDLMNAATAAAVPGLGDWCALTYLPDPSSPPIVAVAHRDPAKVAWAKRVTARFPYDADATTGVATVVRTGEPELLAKFDEATIARVIVSRHFEPDEARALIAELGVTSVVTVPLITRHGVRGAMQFVSAESGRCYDEDDLALAQEAAGRIGEALDLLWIHDQQRRIASTLQAALLPPALPTTAHLDIAVRYWAAGASDVGGDFYDVFTLEPDRWAVVIGDVCGNGPDAAAVTSIARHTIRAAARHGLDHRSVLDWVNQAVLLSDRDLFTTACYATLERGSRGWTMTSVSGGHPLPIVARRSGATEAVGVPGTLLGVFDQIRCQPVSVSLQPGDTMVFFTDGITDLPAPHGMNEAELEVVVTDAAHATTADAVAEEIRRRISERLPIEDRHDDIALVVIRLLDAG